MFLWSLYAKFAANLIDPSLGGFEIPTGTANPSKAYPGSPGILPRDPDVFLPIGWKTLGPKKSAVSWIKDGSNMKNLTLTTPYPSYFVDLTGDHTQATSVPGVGSVFGGLALA